VTVERKEVMWCTLCGARFADDEIKGWGCPKCGDDGVPCGCDRDVSVQVNWHELHILVVWAENWASRSSDVPKGHKVIAAIARRLQSQHPELPHLTLTGEIAAMPAELAKRGVKFDKMESNIAKPPLVPVYGPGAVGHVKA